MGYVSFGWPLCDFPNGIVAYIQNILYGLDDTIKPIILALKLVNSEPKKDLVDISSLVATRGVLGKILDKILYGLKLPCLRSAQYQKGFVLRANYLSLAIQQLSESLNILEIKQSVGTGFFIQLNIVPVVT